MNDTVANVLLREMHRLFQGKTVLDGVGQPFRVECIRVYDDSPDPGWTVLLRSHYETAPPTAKVQMRCCYLDDVLPEVWPFPVVP